VIREYGDAALLIEVDGAEHAQALAAAIDANPPRSVLACIPGMDTVLVEVDPLAVDTDALSRNLERLASGLSGASTAPGRHRSIPVVYGADYGPDLVEVARLTGMNADDVVHTHVAGSLTVAMCGFAPGFAYLDGLAESLAVPRLATPRTSTGASTCSSRRGTPE
jgi:5-oxoprolinase (ATP-hydrolysing) subunit B